MTGRELIRPQAYLEWERKADVRSEFLAGEIFAMAGASQRHNLIVTNLVRELSTQLLDRDCNVYPSDMKVKVERFEKYTYPDVSVVCGDEVFEDEHRDVLLNPTVIFEILSESTEAYDRGAKFAHYQSLTSLREYVLVTQDSPRVEQFVRQTDNTWTYREFHSLDDIVPLEPTGCHLALDRLYLKVLPP